ncbi:hypothetical protein QOT17_015697 [Balamuthia mandrillaris]
MDQSHYYIARTEILKKSNIIQHVLLMGNNPVDQERDGIKEVWTKVSKLLLFVGWVPTSKAARGYICKSFLQQIEMASVLHRDMGRQEPDMKTIRTRFEEQLGLIPGCPEDWDALQGCPLNDGQGGQTEEQQAKDVANDERAVEEQETKMDVEQEQEETNEEQPTNMVKDGDDQGINKDEEMTSNNELAEEREASKKGH